MRELAHVRYQDHCVYVSQHETTGHIHCFKYDHQQCDYRTFEQDESDLAAEYLLTRLPLGHWGFVEDSKS